MINLFPYSYSDHSSDIDACHNLFIHFVGTVQNGYSFYDLEKIMSIFEVFGHFLDSKTDEPLPGEFHNSNKQKIALYVQNCNAKVQEIFSKYATVGEDNSIPLVNSYDIFNVLKDILFEDDDIVIKEEQGDRESFFMKINSMKRFNHI